MDLNLLTALDALLEHNSVAAAAVRLHLTPPAVSRTLARIRHVTGDDILVRAGRSMVPTPYALSIRTQVRALVQEASSVLRPANALDLGTLDRVFTLRGHDALLAALAPALLAAVRTSAPSVRMRFLGEAASGGFDELRNEVDLELGSTLPTQPEVTHEVIGADELVVALRRGHPQACARLTPKKLASLAHLNVSRRGRLHDRLDEAFEALGLTRHVVASLPTAAAALEVVGRSDFVTIVSRTLCAPMCAAWEVVTRPLPLELPAAPIVLAWHRRFDTDVSHTWMRTQVAHMLKTQLQTQG
ncbi:LysR family transcriptional regulator [Roseateles amylovorans]|uniref:LysR family transcriptional regulator n=1 Tax=Roseateles amylovorans TaxID=2978473 RepID=A0ABY6B2D5_9BURK|nr:LysR family transcriptional regulator [Roseateles amylovorans]UXH79082.1 LysR family transcriptional regulator [Roseateles amylovorans]